MAIGEGFLLNGFESPILYRVVVCIGNLYRVFYLSEYSVRETNFMVYSSKNKLALSIVFALAYYLLVLFFTVKVKIAC